MSAKKPAELPFLNIPAVSPVWYETESRLHDPLAYFSSDSDQEILPKTTITKAAQILPKTTVTKAVDGQTAKPVSLPATSEPSSNPELPDGGVLNMSYEELIKIKNKSSSRKNFAVNLVRLFFTGMCTVHV